MTSATSAKIAISNNGKDFSNTISFDTFDSSCQLKSSDGTWVLIVITFILTFLFESVFR